jgi:hypothetical protein
LALQPNFKWIVNKKIMWYNIIELGSMTKMFGSDMFASLTSPNNYAVVGMQLSLYWAYQQQNLLNIRLCHSQPHAHHQPLQTIVF